MTKTRVLYFLLLTGLAILSPATGYFLIADDQEKATTAPAVPLTKETIAKADTAIRKGIAFLRQAQREDGSFAEANLSVPISSLVLHGLLRTERVPVSDPMIQKGLQFLTQHVKDDGGIYLEGDRLNNYSSAIALLAFSEANKKEPKYQAILDNGLKFLRELQWDTGEGVSSEDRKFGGFGYGRKSRPDLSNTQLSIEALRELGISEDDPAMQRAILFLRRTQNFTGEGGNDLPEGAAFNDGGFYYTPAEDYNPGGGDRNDGLRSYGSMTYAGLKSYIYAGLKKDDPRVQAALGWIRKNYTLEKNPGLDQQGLYYYYHTFAKTMDVLGENIFADAEGKQHNWRQELITTLAEKQNEDGSWTNSEKRWMENDARLVTAYSLLGLAYALEPGAK